MLTVHPLGISQSERIVWLCEELGLDYGFKRYERRADNRLAPDEYKALHPMGIAPVITDSSVKGGDLVLSEGGAICDYICGRYGGERLTPGPDDPDFADHLFGPTGDALVSAIPSWHPSVRNRLATSLPVPMCAPSNA